jgi:5-hydroxyisourate hydrolase-like protein (transthyretin family)
MRLETVKIKKWKGLVEAFLKQYKFNLGIALDRTSLMSMEKRSHESVRVYAQRWRDEATHVQPPLIKTEMVTLFVNTFKAPYYEHLIGSSSQHFYDVVRIAKRIEQDIKVWHIPEPLEKIGFY